MNGLMLVHHEKRLQVNFLSLLDAKVVKHKKWNEQLKVIQ